MNIQLHKLTSCSLQVQQQIREWHNLPEVRRWMWIQHIITEKEHQGWLDALKTDKKQLWFVVHVDNAPVGVVGTKGIDLYHKVAQEIVIYIPLCKGIAVRTMNKFIDYLFENYGIDKVACQYIEGNIVEHVHNKVGLLFEGLFHNQAILDGKPTNVICRGMTRERWKFLNLQKDLTEEERAESFKSDTEMSNQFWEQYIDEVKSMTPVEK